MADVARFAVLGLGPGAVWALSALGLVLVYRGSGVLNFAHGPVGLLAALIAWQLQGEEGWPWGIAAGVAIAFVAIVGAAFHLLVIRPLEGASGLARVVATLAAGVALTSAMVLIWGPDPKFPRGPFPAWVWHVGSVAFYADRVFLLLIAGVLALALWLTYRFSRFGLATTAVAESRRSAAALGHSPHVIAAVNWGVGSALAGLAAVLVAPIASLSPTGGSALQLAPLAAAVTGGFRSFPITIAAGIGIGVAQGELAHYNQPPTNLPGLADAFPFFVILAVLLLRGRALPLRDAFLERPPRVGTGRVDLQLVVPAVVGAAAVVGYALPVTWTDAVTSWSGAGIVALSVVVVTGYAGQLSLAQTALAGGGVLIALRLASQAGLPLWAAVPLALASMALLGAVAAIPATRVRGANLAILTLGLGIAMERMVYPSSVLTGGLYLPRYDGSPDIFGWDVDAIAHSNRYAVVCVVALALTALAVANLRRGRTGRRLLALRANERAAAALGVGVVGGKVYAFALGSAIAALGGILLAFRNPYPRVADFPAADSAAIVTLAMIGGVGYLLGPLLGSAFASGALVAQVAGLARYLPLATAVLLLALLVWSQDGVASRLVGLGRRMLTRPPRARNDPGSGLERCTTAQHSRPDPGSSRSTVTPRALELREVRVHYGAVVAVDRVSLAVRPGQVVGLIGPNGSGKSSLIDAVTGFVDAAGGAVLLDGRRVDRLAPTARARGGISRSFQSLELFEDLTARENLQVAADPRDRLAYLRDLVAPSRSPLPDAVAAIVERFGLEPHLDEPVESLSYGTRRRLAIARAVATLPSVLLLDEPAAGLSDAEKHELAPLVRSLADDLGMAVLLVEHDVELVLTTCGTVAVLDHGRLIAHGTPDAVRRDPAVVEAYIGHDEADI